ncbi:MAG: hypothetical protein ACFE8J_19800 [Candidatus Heimdallarchaeota archaeon]
MNTFPTKKNVKRSRVRAKKIILKNVNVDPHHAELRKIQASPIVIYSLCFEEKYLIKILIPIINEIIANVNVKLP